ncbi:hypothetical protein [Bradyrhizobium zhanjiangense]|uniref:Uncharacterized protein n=1 Tax=Bradyrhizobium zhanjiangense TaxID=1325107 RepID=A0A4V1L2L1_9BRAD|nr:hypothetical protein [Bradyrhizobium zhanjiangense]RXH31989.1 hypothetical protein XH94_32510 [Bradyrhizobium zhanjiangense]
MSGNHEKIHQAEKVTDVIVDGFNGAQRALSTCWVNGYGVLTDPSRVQSDLHRAKQEIDKALAAMRNFRAWPTHEDYGG